MRQIQTIVWSVIQLLAFITWFSPSLCAQQPNIIFILTDDLGYGDFGCYGATDVATPHIDQMAVEGSLFDAFYVSSVCSPTRASFMTGCRPQTVGIGGVLFQRSPIGLSHEENTIAELLQEEGYATALIGKWHLGFRTSQNPLHHGFDYWYGTISSNSTNYNLFDQEFSTDCVFREGLTAESAKAAETVKCPLLRNNEMIEVPADQTQLTKRYTAETVEFINKHKDRPFFIYLAHNMPHIPLYVSPDFEGVSERGLYGDVIEELDWGIGTVLQALKDHGLDENTIVVLTSDNGPKTSVGGSAGPLRAGKGSSYEGGVRVPCIMRWPGHIPAQIVNETPITIMDMLPTLLTLAGGTVPEQPQIHGKNVWSTIAGTASTPPHEAIYYIRVNSMAGVRVGDWKYILGEWSAQDAKPEIALTPEERRLPRAERKELVKQKRRALTAHVQPPGPELYNLSEDKGEQNNVIADHPELAARLQKMMADTMDQVRAGRRLPDMAE